MTTIRNYQKEDCEALARLFYETVHTVNAVDYTARQLCAWAKNADSLTRRSQDLLRQHTVVAETDGEISGFGSIDGSGYLDLLFVHKNFQRQGIATALCNVLEKGYPSVRTHASITAKPFFERRGYLVLKAQEVERDGVKLKNFEMLKIQNPCGGA